MNQLRSLASNMVPWVLAGMCLVGACDLGGTAYAQSAAGVDPYTNQRIEAVQIRISNPSRDTGINARIEDSVRTTVALFPGAYFSKEQFEFQLSQARRIRDVAALDYDISFGALGGLDITIEVSIGESTTPEGRGMVFGGDFPTIYEKDGTFVRARLDLFGLYYANNNSWYGRPDLMLAGNPLVQGEPAGRGYENWIEGYAHYGVYGITPLADELYVYGGASAISAVSAGQELFSDKTRSFTGIEDAFGGFIGGKTDADGNRFSYNLTAGRQRFTLANGFLIANTASNGHDRAALQANGRWASDLFAQARFRYNTTMLEVFYLDPDELPIIDSGSTFAGINLEFQPVANMTVGASYVTSPKSDFGYFGPAGPVGTREGLQVFDARFTYAPNGPGASGFFLGGEYAMQRNSHFDMDARAGWAEVGYSFAETAWSPAISYRFSKFSGDNPDTATFERWDPMLSGGNGEQWVQGANHFKVVQDSNVIAHRVQVRLRPSPKIELVPQFWAFYADSENNVGGNPALSFLNGKEYGFEANMTAKWFVNRNIYVHGHVAYTWAGDATRDALSGDADDWLSAMMFIRYAF